MTRRHSISRCWEGGPACFTPTGPKAQGDARLCTPMGNVPPAPYSLPRDDGHLSVSCSAFPLHRAGHISSKKSKGQQLSLTVCFPLPRGNNWQSVPKPGFFPTSENLQLRVTGIIFRIVSKWFRNITHSEEVEGSWTAGWSTPVVPSPCLQMAMNPRRQPVAPSALTSTSPTDCCTQLCGHR